MTPREFFYLVASMRDAQRRYFRDRDQAVLRAARKLEGLVDHEIDRVTQIVRAQEQRRNETMGETYSVSPIVNGGANETIFSGDLQACREFVTALKMTNPDTEVIITQD